MLYPTIILYALSLALSAAALSPFELGLHTPFHPRQTMQLALNEPPDGSLYLGFWVDTSVTSGDSPLALNERLGQNASFFQFSQNIPVDPYNDVTGTGGIINGTQVLETNTDAGIYVTVYPLEGFGGYGPQDLAALGLQLQSYVSAGHAVFLRFAPEMNGNWFPYATQPTAFKAAWIELYTAVKISCPTCAIVWSPNAALGYPFGITPDVVPNATDRAALDTNGDGVYDNTDDAYSPYYPGDAYVDWTGVSYYFKGNFPNSYNVIQPNGFVDGAMTGVLEAVADIQQQETQYTEFYNSYCLRVPCMLSESGAAWKVNETGLPYGFVDPTHEAVEAGWWQDGITNLTFLTTYPKMKMIMNFEWEKVETDGGIPTLRDFRLTNDSSVLAGFKRDLESVADRYVWASYKAPPTASSGQPAPQIPLPQPTPTVQRATPYRATNPPPMSLFSDAALSAYRLGALAVALAVGISVGASMIV